MHAQGTSPTRDERWFEELFRRHHAAVHAYVFRRVPGDGDDLVAEVFTIAWRKREQVPDAALPWLYGVAAREVLHAHRATSRQRSLALRLAADADLAAPDASDESAARISAEGLVTRALARLAAADAEVLRLWAWEQLEPAEIATVLGTSSVAARVRLHRARKRLEAVLARQAHSTRISTPPFALPMPSPRLTPSEFSHE